MPPPPRISIDPTPKGYIAIVYTDDIDRPDYTTDTFISRTDALEVAETWLDRREFEGREREEGVPQSEHEIAQANGVGLYRSRL